MTTDTTLQTPTANDCSSSTDKNKPGFLKQTQTWLALNDLKEGTLKWRIWFMLAYLDVKLRYRRSVLGPFWITISMAITVYSMGYLYSHLFHSDLQSYFPFLVAGMLSWSIISTAIMELTDTFIISDGMIKQIKLPYTLYIHRVATRNIIIFLHNILVIIPILIIFHQVAKVNFNTLLLIPDLILFYLNTVTYGIILAIIGARYRDVSQIIKSLIQVAFFLTPVMWNPIILPENDRHLVLLNPFYSMVELIRAPMLGTAPSWQIMTIITVITLAGITISFIMLKKYRARIVYWL